MNPLALAQVPESWVHHPLYVSFTSPTLRTVERAIIERIMPSDEVRVKIWVAPREDYDGIMGGDESTIGELIAVDRLGDIAAKQDAVDVKFEFDEFTKRDTPEWWDDGKFGIL
jgi:hypothetical protein